jgi:hypothetical protein
MKGNPAIVLVSFSTFSLQTRETLSQGGGNDAKQFPLKISCSWTFEISQSIRRCVEQITGPVMPTISDPSSLYVHTLICEWANFTLCKSSICRIGEDESKYSRILVVFILFFINAIIIIFVPVSITNHLYII